MYLCGLPVELEKLKAWAVTQNTTSQAVLEAFIGQFGSTAYGPMARARLDELNKSQLAVVAPPAQLSKAIADPVLIGTFEHDSVIDDYDWHFIYSIAPDGTYRLVTIVEEHGTYHGGDGKYRTVATKTGRVRTGTYRAAGSAAIELRSTTGAAIFRPVQANITINQAHPFMLGIWRANIMQGGLRWTVTIQNNPDGTYHYQGLTEDNGSCVVAEQQWQTTSAVTGKSNTGTYRVVDARNVEIGDAIGATLWRRR